MSIGEDFYRWSVLVGLLLIMPIGLYYRIRAHATGEKLDRLQEGWFILIGLRLLGAGYAVGLILYLIRPAWMAWAALPLPDGLRLVGLLLGALAIPLFAWSFHHLGKNLTDTVVTRKEHSLVTTGPYHWVRHPFYVAWTLYWLASALLTANGFLFVTGAGVLALLLVRTRTEEAKLLERFGDDYRRYRARTGAFFPRPGGRE